VDRRRARPAGLDGEPRPSQEHPVALMARRRCRRGELGDLDRRVRRRPGDDHHRRLRRPVTPTRGRYAARRAPVAQWKSAGLLSPGSEVGPPPGAFGPGGPLSVPPRGPPPRLFWAALWARRSPSGGAEGGRALRTAVAAAPAMSVAAAV